MTIFKLPLLMATMLVVIFSSPTTSVETDMPVQEIVEIIEVQSSREIKCHVSYAEEAESAFLIQSWTEDELIILTKMLWGEAGGVTSDTEKAACVWCVLNRVDAGYGDITTVVTTPGQYVGYRENNPVNDDLKALCEDVLTRWQLEKSGVTGVGRVLPKDYQYFSGYGGRNWFRNAYQNGTIWDWSLESPYES